MFKFNVLTVAYEDTAALLKAISNNIVYAYGVIDTIGDVCIKRFKTKKSTESEAILTNNTPTPVIGPMTNMGMDTGFVCMVTGTAGGQPALAYIIDDLTGYNASVINNLDSLATAMGYDEWFIAPQIHVSNEFIGAGAHSVCAEFKVELSGAASPFTVVANETEVIDPTFVLDVLANPPHTLQTATWTGDATVRDALIEYMRANPNFKIARRGTRPNGPRYIMLTQRQYITDLENVQDVLRQVSMATVNDVVSAVSDISDVSNDVATEAATRLAADVALRDAIGGIAVFGNTFKQIVDTNKAVEQYIPRP